ncbi:MAG: signal peptidase I [Pseudomonadota bacterium]
MFPKKSHRPPVERGDILVFKLPSDTSIVYVKRVVGMPGDTIEMRDGVLHINGNPVKRERLDDFIEQTSSKAMRRVPRFRETLPNGATYDTLDLTPDSQLDNTREYNVPDGHYFVLGDHRDHSIDSRVRTRVGYVPASNVVGIAIGVYYSGETRSLTWRTLKPAGRVH